MNKKDEPTQEQMAEWFGLTNVPEGVEFIHLHHGSAELEDSFSFQKPQHNNHMMGFRMPHQHASLTGLDPIQPAPEADE